MSDTRNPNPSDKNGDFWGVEKPVDHAAPLAPAAGDQPAAPAAWTAPTTTPARKRRRWVWVVGGVAGVLVLTVALAPTFAGVLAPSIAPGMVPVRGKVEIDAASFGWFSSQTIGPARLLDDKGQEVARFSATVDTGLLPLLFGSRDLGTIKVTGAANIVQAADGTTNLQTALAPAAPPGASSAPTAATKEPLRLPSGFAAKIRGAFDVTYTNAAEPAKSGKLKNLTVDADVAAGQPLTLNVAGKAEQASGTGDIAVKLNVQDWSTSDGALNVDPANPLAADKPRIDLAAEVASFPVALVDAFKPDLRLRSALGDTASLRATVKGGLKQADVTVAFTAPNARTTAALEIKDGVLRSTAPIEVFASGAALSGLSPAAEALTAPLTDPSSTRLVVQKLPDITLTLTDVVAKLPTSGPLDLRGAAANITVATTAVSGSGISTGTQRSTFALAPLTATVRAQDLAKGLTLKAATQATIDGKPAGVVDIDLTTGSVLDASGQPIKSLPAGLAGHAHITGIATSIAQPFVKDLDLQQAVGPTLDLRLSATSTGAPAPSTPGALPPANLDLVVTSQHLTADGKFALEGDTLRTRAEGLTARAASAAALAAKFLPPNTVALRSEGQAALTVKNLNVPIGGNLNFANLAADITVSADRWTVTDPAGAHPLAIDTLTADLALARKSPRPSSPAAR